MKTNFLLVLVLLLSTTIVVAQEKDTFTLNENVNYRFRCYDETGQYCTSGTVLIMNVEYPDGSNALDNQTMTFNQTHFNATLPTDKIGINYKVLIHSPTSNNTITEFTYDVTTSGFNERLGSFGIFIILIILVVYAIAFIGFFGGNPVISIFGGLAMMIIGVTIINQGILIFRNDLTIAFAAITIGLGAFFSIGEAVEMTRESYG